MAGKKGQKKRFWSDEEKRSICDQARVADVSVAQVARRYALNTNLIGFGAQSLIGGVRSGF